MKEDCDRDSKGRFKESREKIRQRIAEKAMVVLLERGSMSYSQIAEDSYWMAECMIRESEVK